jgi:hypothetical protein
MPLLDPGAKISPCRSNGRSREYKNCTWHIVGTYLMLKDRWNKQMNFLATDSCGFNITVLKLLCATEKTKANPHTFGFEGIRYNFCLEIGFVAT